MASPGCSNLSVAFLNIHGQSGFNVAKQKQIEDFIRSKSIDILHCQEIHIEEETFNQCNYITSNFNIISNNALNKYGTATLVKNEFSVENIVYDSNGRAIIFDIENLTLEHKYFVKYVIIYEIYVTGIKNQDEFLKVRRLEKESGTSPIKK